MSDTTFVDYNANTPVVAAWLNDVNVVTYRALGSGGVAPTTSSQVLTNLGLSLNPKKRNTPYDYGCKGDGVTDDTANFQAMVNAISDVDLADGTYKISAITFPSTFKRMRGRGSNSQLVATGTIGSHAPWLYFANCTDVDVGDFSTTLSSSSYPLSYTFQFSSCNRGTVSNIHMTDGGYIATYAPACAGILFENIVVSTFIFNLFLADNSPTNLTLNNLQTYVASTDHTIKLQGGANNIITGCYTAGAGSGNFGIFINQESYCQVFGNIINTTTREGINVTDGSRNIITDNIIICGTGHNDFGISLYAFSVDIRDNIVDGNVIYLSGGPGIGIATNSTYHAFYNTVSSNVIASPYQGPNTPSVACAVLLYGGTGCTLNVVTGNSCFDESNKMVYGVAEWNNGNGIPNGNKLINNACIGGGVFLSEGLVIGSISEVHDLTWNVSTPTPTSQGGSISGSTATVKYKRRGRSADFSILVNISSTNTGTGYVSVASPITIVNGSLVGEENTTGKMLQANSGGAGLIRLYDYARAYPTTGTNTFLQASGTVEI